MILINWFLECGGFPAHYSQKLDKFNYTNSEEKNKYGVLAINAQQFERARGFRLLRTNRYFIESLEKKYSFKISALRILAGKSFFADLINLLGWK